MMCTRAQCQQHVGRWIQFRTPYGQHVGMVERVTADQAIVLSPRHLVPQHLASPVSQSDEDKLDLALAFWGGGYPSAGAGPRTGYGYGAGRGIGGYAGGWQRWAVSFLIIYALFGLWAW